MRYSYSILSVFLGFLYAVIGVLVLIYKKFFIELEPKWAVILGIVFIVYGVFRMYRAVKKIRNLKENE
jgi:hypothetical protein